jgi:hypothetical protein
MPPVENKEKRSRPDPRRARTAVGISRVRAAALARAKVARELIACSVYESRKAGKIGVSRFGFFFAG